MHYPDILSVLRSSAIGSFRFGYKYHYDISLLSQREDDNEFIVVDFQRQNLVVVVALAQLLF